MAIRIETIKVYQLGPITEFQMELGTVNLIYARNEQGKTHLLEFMVQSLFKKGAIGSIRSLDGCRGEVCVSGLDDKLRTFGMQSRGKKLEDTLTENNFSLPPSIGRMLVVRAGEVALANNAEGGVNRAILKEFLSNEGFLDTVEKQISKTVQGTLIDPNGTINGARTGDLKTREEYLGQLKEINKLLEQINEIYSGGNLALLLEERSEIEERLAQSNRARRHLAWRLFIEMEQLKLAKGNLPRQQIVELQHEVWQYLELVKQLNKKQTSLLEKQAQCVHFGWLVEAINSYKELATKNLERPKSVLVMGVAACLIAGIVASFLKYPILTLVFSLMALGLGWVFFRNTLALIANASASKEREVIGAEYYRRFNIPFSGLAGMEEQRKQLEPQKAAADYLLTEVENDRRRMEELTRSIEQKFRALASEPENPGCWDETITKMLARLKDLETQLGKLQLQHDLINLTSADYLEQDPGLEYNPDEFQTCQNALEKIKEQIKAEMELKSNLKFKIAMQTGSDSAGSWEILIHALQEKRKSIGNAYRILTAKICAGVLVYQALSTLRKKEEEHIQTGLQSKLVLEPLKRLTGKYEQLALNGEKLMVNDGLGDFSLADLSTGAQEQILLALRIGFARKWMEQNSMFLILDDAFQHSDWERRVHLVDEMANLARRGWQIIYLSMDDHIRKLFEDRVKPQFGDQYRYRELTPKPV